MKRCGLLGQKLGHSYSPAIHALLADYTYQLYEREPEELESFLRTGDWDGLNVTIPYKKAVVPYCAELSALARELGSVNTLVRRPDGSLYGDNTDAWGFAAAVRRLGLQTEGKKALVLGSGGASVTVQAVLRSMGCRVVVISRSGADRYENIDRHADAGLLVNATPVGMYPNNGESHVNLDLLPRLEGVVDLVYNPARTRLLLDAEARGIACESGLYMLVGQAVRACELWTGKTLSAQTLENVWREIGSRMQNLILIGMPGSGKTTIGRKLAQELNREFIDVDETLVTQIGNISDFFAAHGEEAFRREETRVLCDLGKRSGLVIATGGGCVTQGKNYDLLHQNGTLIWLQRPLELLPTDGRPVSQRDGVTAIFEKRKLLYAQFSDMIVQNQGTPQSVVREILQKSGRGQRL